MITLSVCFVESSSDEEEAKEEFCKEALDAHNAYRKRHGAKPLKYSKKVAPEKKYKLSIFSNASVFSPPADGLCPGMGR